LRFYNGGKYTHLNPVCQEKMVLFLQKKPKKIIFDALQLKKYIFAR